MDRPNGRFPKMSSRGSQYIIVLTESDSSAIFVEPMKNRSSGEMILAYQALISCLNSAGIFPKEHILGNECSADFKAIIKTNKMSYQLVPPTITGAIGQKKPYRRSKTTSSPSSAEQTPVFRSTSGTDSSSKPSTHSTCCDQPRC